MKRGYFVYAFLLVMFFALLPFAVADDPVPKTVTEKIELFNGNNLDNWYVFLKDKGVNNDPDRVFTVSDGMIHISGNGFGCITTQEAYENYRVIVEYKWGEKTWQSRTECARDCGLLVHSIGEDGAYGETWMCSIEANIIEGGTGDFIVVGDGTDRFQITANVLPDPSRQGAWIYNRDGKPVTVQDGRIDWFGRDPEWRDQTNFRGKNDVDKPHGEWNRMEVVAAGDKLDVYVNDVLVNQARNVKPSGGRIQIQVELAEIFIRRITLLPLK